MTDRPPWTTLDSRILVEDRWIRLRADRLRSDTGAEIAPWYVLDYPDWVAAAVLTADDRLVMIRQWRHAARVWSLELPGGIIDPDDTDPVAAAMRETREETGYVADSWSYVQCGFANPAIQTNRLHVVLGSGARAAAAPAPEAGESIQVVPMPVPDVLAELRAGRIGQSMHVGAILVGLAAAGRISL